MLIQIGQFLVCFKPLVRTFWICVIESERERHSFDYFNIFGLKLNVVADDTQHKWNKILLFLLNKLFKVKVQIPKMLCRVKCLMVRTQLAI